MSLAVRTILPLVPRGAAGCAYASPRGPAARDPGTWTEPSSRSGKGSLVGELVDPLYVPSNDPCPVSSNGKTVSEKRYPPPSRTIAPSNETVGALGESDACDGVGGIVVESYALCSAMETGPNGHVGTAVSPSGLRNSPVEAPLLAAFYTGYQSVRTLTSNPGASGGARDSVEPVGPVRDPAVAYGRASTPPTITPAIL